MTKPRLVLATAPVSLEERYGAYSAAANTQPSFGLLSLASTALKQGADVRVLEAAACNLGLPQTIEEALSFSPDILGISSTTLGIMASADLAKAVKLRSPGTLILIGGCHVSALPEETMREFPSFDIAALGEGEQTLAEIISAVASGTAVPKGIPGTCFRDGDKVTRAPARDPIHNLDDLPLPAWSLLDGFPAQFRPSPARIMHWPCASIVMTRGCPNACTFCDRSVFGRNCRSYSPRYAADLCEDLCRKHGVREILIEDDTFIISRKNVAGICEELIKRKLNLSWSCLGRADRVDLELLQLMRKAGCWHISFGVESADESILKAVNKNLDLDQIMSALQMCRAAGIRTKGFFMVGFPNESEKSIAASEALVRTIPLDDISVMHLTPFPGSELYDKVDTLGTFNKDWRTMNALNPVFIPHGMTIPALEQGRNRILKAFFSRPDVMFRHATHAIRNPRLIPYYASGVLSLLSVLRGKKNAS